MRMWRVNPKILCIQHLLGEHFEIHKHRHNFVKMHNISGRIRPVTQIEPDAMQSRHDPLVEELILRGVNHKSPYEQPSLEYLSDDLRYAKVDRLLSLRDLLSRCSKCKDMYLKLVDKQT